MDSWLAFYILFMKRGLPSAFDEESESVTETVI